jgi:hypothetical protein
MTSDQQQIVLNAWFDHNDGRLPESPEEIEWFVDGGNCPQEASREELVAYLLTEIL